MLGTGTATGNTQLRETNQSTSTGWGNKAHISKDGGALVPGYDCLSILPLPALSCLWNWTMPDNKNLYFLRLVDMGSVTSIWNSLARVLSPVRLQVTLCIGRETRTSEQVTYHSGILRISTWVTCFLDLVTQSLEMSSRFFFIFIHQDSSKYSKSVLAY